MPEKPTPAIMFPQVFRAVRELWPRTFILENVRGLTRTTFRPYFDYIIDQLRTPSLRAIPGERWEGHKQRITAARALEGNEASDHGYTVQHRVYNVADFGVPQQRHRVFIVGIRTDLPLGWSFPEPTHSEEALLYAQYVDGSYWAEHALSRRPIPPRLVGRIACLAAMPKPPTKRWRTVRDAIADLPEPFDYLQHPSYDNHLGIPDARSYVGHTGSPWDWPAKAIKAGDHGNPGGENMLRRDDGTVRYFTVRELARLQSFPDTWHFANSWTENRRQLGNAVPVAMAELLGRKLYELLTLYESDAAQPHETRELTPAF